ncbi:MAG TPA: AP2 domain-containing protein [Blastocatellia bacterium]|nr:AP2 domain-containing protein [Blastocatellia bacterium]
MAKSGHKGISRIDQSKKNTHGWYVRVRFNGTQRVKFFSDNQYGGKEKALEEAIRFRNRAEQEMGKPRTDRLVIASNPRNRSGIMGIRRKTKVVKTENGERVVSNVYEVSWNPEPGRLCRTWVSIDKLGEKEALKEACRIRREKEREMYGSVVRASWAASLSKLLDA